MHFGNAKAEEDAETEAIRKVRENKFTVNNAAPARAFQGVRGKSQFPGAFRHFGIQNGTWLNGTF